jgi:hypothetical protein
MRTGSMVKPAKQLAISQSVVSKTARPWDRFPTWLQMKNDRMVPDNLRRSRSRPDWWNVLCGWQRFVGDSVSNHKAPNAGIAPAQRAALGRAEMSIALHDLPYRPEQAGADWAPARFPPDLHSKRIALDLAAWYGRLARLAEMRAGGQ